MNIILSLAKESRNYSELVTVTDCQRSLLYREIDKANFLNSAFTVFGMQMARSEMEARPIFHRGISASIARDDEISQQSRP